MGKMKELIAKKSVKMKLLEYTLLIAVYCLGYFLNLYSGFLSCLILVAAGLFYYLYFSLTGERSYLKFKAVFSGVWLCTIGLAQLRFLEYQSNWVLFTWINLAVAHFFFLLANDLAAQSFPFFENKFNLKKLNGKNLPFEYNVHSDRLFWIATIFTGIGVLCFFASVIIKGYIPFFASSSNTGAYVDFYTRFHIFIVAGMVSGGLAYFCIKKCQLSMVKKVFSGIYIAVMVFVIPILMVQRGTFLNAALILTAVIYLLSNRKFHVLLICVVVMFGVYQFGSSLRGYSDTQLSELFQPKEIDIGSKDNVIQLSPKEAFLYSYLTVSQDNFNSAIENKTYNTWGIWQVEPFNVILRSNWITERYDKAKLQAEGDTVLPYLNTFNLISMAYYDFGIIGVILLISLWSFLFGIVEAFNRKYKGVFSSLAYGVCLIPVALCFFDPWMSNFTFWLLLGTVFIMFLIASFTLKRRGAKQ